MNDTIEQNLRAALSELAASRSADADARLCAVDYHPRSGRARWPIAGLAGTVVAAGAATAAVLLSSTAPGAFAFAGWTGVPTPPTASAVAAATAACNAMHPANGPLTGTPVLTEARDRYTAALYVTPSTGWNQVCMSDGSVADSTVAGGRGALELFAAPGPDQLGQPEAGASTAPGFAGTLAAYQGKAPSWWSALASSTGAGKSVLPYPQGFLRHAASLPIEQYFVGLAGHDVRAVMLLFDQGVTVDATVENGWYFAWWPGEALPDSIQVTTASGTTTSSRVPGTVGWQHACEQTGGERGSPSSTGSCGVFATGLRPSALRKQQAWLKAHGHAAAGRTGSRR